ncbi:MAG: hypothetical protein Q9227_006316 [Pyrenula ochraceoflavens]
MNSAETKRKRREDRTEKPRKRIVVDEEAAKVKVTFPTESSALKPAFVSSPGIRLPRNLHFESYTDQHSRTPELLLHSSSHPSIDFIGRDEQIHSGQNHYLAAYNPRARSIQLLEAKHLTARASVRQRPTENDNSEDDTSQTPLKKSTKAALTEAFGNKKSKKRVQAFAENALLHRNRNDTNTALSDAIVSSLPAVDSIDTAEAIKTRIQENKPLPTPNLDAITARDVYSLNTLAHPSGESTLLQMPIEPWLECVRSQDTLEPTRHRFISQRLHHLALVSLHSDSPSTSTPLHVLRYIQLHLSFANLAHTCHYGRRIPSDTFKWISHFTGPDSDQIPQSVLASFKRRYINGPDNVSTAMTDWTWNLLYSTICALTLHLPPPENVTVPADELRIRGAAIQELAADLNIETRRIRKIFRELGCRIESVKPDSAEAKKWGLNTTTTAPVDEDGGTPKSAGRRTEIIRLTVPLQFPKESKGPQAGGGRRP